jgi:hypothetical protein
MPTNEDFDDVTGLDENETDEVVNSTDEDDELEDEDEGDEEEEEDEDADDLRGATAEIGSIVQRMTR